jgi:hypothetical protein
MPDQRTTSHYSASASRADAAYPASSQVRRTARGAAPGGLPGGPQLPSLVPCPFAQYGRSTSRPRAGQLSSADADPQYAAGAYRSATGYKQLLHNTKQLRCAWAGALRSTRCRAAGCLPASAEAATRGPHRHPARTLPPGTARRQPGTLRRPPGSWPPHPLARPPALAAPSWACSPSAPGRPPGAPTSRRRRSSSPQASPGSAPAPSAWAPFCRRSSRPAQRPPTCSGRPRP